MSAFQTTQWSLIAAAAGLSTETSAALDELCRAYRPPVYSFVRRYGYGPADADDRVQGFFASLLERNDLASVDRRRGRFRSWLLGALRNYLSNEWRHEHALKRGGRTVVLSIDQLAAEGRDNDEPADPITPEHHYERRWAVTLLARVLDRLEREYAAQSDGARFAQLRGFLVGDEPPSYEELAGRLGCTADTLRVQVCRLRRRYRELVRREIADTVEHATDVDDELRHLIAAVASGGTANGRS